MRTSSTGRWWPELYWILSDRSRGGDKKLHIEWKDRSLGTGDRKQDVEDRTRNRRAGDVGSETGERGSEGGEGQYGKEMGKKIPHTGDTNSLDQCG